MNVKKLIVISLATLSGVCFGVAVSTHLLVTGALSSSYRAYIVQSGSMEPALKTGSIVITRSAEKYKAGDIITFTGQGTSQITHRILGVETENGETVFTTKGDANEETDSAKVRGSQIIGKSFISIPHVGYFADFVRTPKGFVILVVIPASIIVYEELKTIIKTLKQSFSRLSAQAGKRESGMTKSSLLIPVLGVFFLFLGTTGSFFLDNEASTTNVLGAAETFSSPAPTPSATPSPTPTPLNLVINEFMPQPTTGEFDWVEIYNPTDTPISLIGWTIDEGDQNPKLLDSFVSIPAFGFVVYEHTNNAWLDNAGETIDLIDPTNQVVDFQIYGGSTPGVSRGSATDGTGVFFTCLAPSRGLSNNGICQL